MKILFIHQNFPGQFKHLAPALSQLGHDVRALTMNDRRVPGIQSTKYSVKQSTSKTIFPLATDFETKLIRAEGCAQALKKLSESGFYPDLVIAHPGWGETMFLKDIFPNTKQLHFLEFYYNNTGGDVGFDPEFDNIYTDASFRVTVKNAHVLMALNDMDRAYAPTQWQKSRYPKAFHSKIDVIFDGINTSEVKPSTNFNRSQVSLKNANGQTRTLHEGDQVITFVNRNLEPYRGYHVFMRALPQILKKNPKAIVIIVGGDATSYGSAPPPGKTWKSVYLDEVKDRLDLSRVFFLGNLAYEQYLHVLRLSDCHVYLTYPFVLSWSCLEAMSMECVVVGSDTPPVAEVIEHGHNGLLVDFFDIEKLSDQITKVLVSPNDFLQMRKNARQTVVERYDLHAMSLPRQLAIVEEMLQESK
jgi:glycosyltransferase involved in cell wall biosynthesis